MRLTRSAGAHFASASAVFAALLLTAACSGSPSTDPSQSPVGPASSTVPLTPAASPTPSQPSADADAVARVRAYVALIDKLRSNPKANLDQLSTVARGKAADNWRQILLNDRSAGHRQTGTTKLSVINTKAGTSDQQWLVTMCLDVTDVDIVDRSGKSIVSKNRPDRVRDELTVDQDPSSSKWYVTGDKVTETC